MTGLELILEEVWDLEKLELLQLEILQSHLVEVVRVRFRHLGFIDFFFFNLKISPVDRACAQHTRGRESRGR